LEENAGGSVQKLCSRVTDIVQQYYVHVAKPITDAEKSEIEKAIGTTLGVYIPHNTFLMVDPYYQYNLSNNSTLKSINH